MAETAVRVEPAATAPTGRMLADQVTYAWRDFWRTKVMAFVVLGFPLVFLLMLGISGGDVELGSASEGFQEAAPSAVVFGAVLAAYVMLPFGVAQARERGVLKRLRGTPLPWWCYLAGRVASAVAVAALGTAIMLATAVMAFGLEVPLRMLPAMVVTFLAGVVCFAALGLAVVALLRGSEAVVTFTMGSFLLTAFGSGILAPDLTLPRPLDLGSWFLPLRHLTTAFTGTFDGASADAGFAWQHLAVLLLWALVAALVAVRRLSVEPPASAASPVRAQRARDGRRGAGSRSGERPTLAVLVWAQFRQANRAVWRQPSSVFFSIAFPALFAIVVPYAFGQPVIDGVELAALVVPAMAVFGAVITAYVNLPEGVAIARDKGILKRLRGTPLPAVAYVLGRLASTLWIGAITVVVVFGAGWLVHGVVTPWRAVPALGLVFAVGILVMAALGLAVVAMVRDAAAVPAVTLATFLPLAFISDMLAFGAELPGVVQTVGWLFPVKHLVYATDAATAGELGVGYLAVLLAWGLAGTAVAVRWFRWEPS